MERAVRELNGLLEQGEKTPSFVLPR